MNSHDSTSQPQEETQTIEPLTQLTPLSKELLNQSNLEKILSKYGQGNQLERFKEGFLLEMELEELIINLLFEPWAGFKKVKWDFDIVPHDDCPKVLNNDRISIHTVTTDIRLTSNEFEVLKKIRSVTYPNQKIKDLLEDENMSFSLSFRSDEAYCTWCRSDGLKKNIVNISIFLFDRHYDQNYEFEEVTC